ncbi:hypothetical protein [Paraglaciecola aestuariivivens]
MNVTLQESALLADIISALAIVISLIFVGLQIKDNTKATQASTFHEIASLDIQLLLNFASSQESARVSTLFRENPNELSDEDKNYGFICLLQKCDILKICFYKNKVKC